MKRIKFVTDNTDTIVIVNALHIYVGFNRLGSTKFDARCFEMCFPSMRNLLQTPYGEPREKVGSSPGGAAVYWRSARVVAPDLTCCRRKISSVLAVSPGALMHCLDRGSKQKSYFK